MNGMAVPYFQKRDIKTGKRCESSIICWSVFSLFFVSGTTARCRSPTLQLHLKWTELNEKYGSETFTKGTQLWKQICLILHSPGLVWAVGGTGGDGYYLGHTCLTLEMAYLNSRVISMPFAPWLTELVK